MKGPILPVPPIQGSSSSSSSPSPVETVISEANNLLRTVNSKHDVLEDSLERAFKSIETLAQGETISFMHLTRISIRVFHLVRVTLSSSIILILMVLSSDEVIFITVLS